MPVAEPLGLSLVIELDVEVVEEAEATTANVFAPLMSINVFARCHCGFVGF